MMNYLNMSATAGVSNMEHLIFLFFGIAIGMYISDMVNKISKVKCKKPVKKRDGGAK